LTAPSYFSGDYAEARQRFLDSARAVGAAHTAYDNPNRGPKGEALHTDTAWLGPKDAERVLVTVSGTHGAEGFCGSGVQVGWFESGLAEEHHGDIAYLAIHAINSHGFAWLRRVTEDNVDLNRNFVDFGRPLPENAAYRELADLICPKTWDEATISKTHDALSAYAEKHGPRALQSAVSAGQYSHPDGIFYGGQAPTWSHRTLKRIFETELANAKQAAVIDYHTGLGPRGHGERICCHAVGSDNLTRAEQWYEGDFTSPLMGTSSSVELNGVNLFGMEQAAQNTDLTVIALEYGTQDTQLVKLALRADNWLHLHGDPESEQGRAIKQQIREAFYQDADDWKQMIWDRGVETQRLALRGLRES